MLNTARKVRTRFDIVLMAPICDSCSSRPVNVRVGYEDNFYLPNGEMAVSNGELAAAAASIIRSTGREVASAAEARQKMSLPPRG